MKRKLMLSLVALCGGLTIVGSGFSAWYFEVKNLAASNSINHYVTDLNTEIGTLTDLNKDEKLYVILDQGGYLNKADATKGISITKLEDNKTMSDTYTGAAVNTLGANYSVSKVLATKLVAAGITEGKFTAEFKLTDKAYTYLTFNAEGDTKYTGGKDLVTGGTLTVTQQKVSYEYVVNFTTIASGKDETYSQDFKFDSSTTDSVNVMLSYYNSDYASGAKQKPQDDAAYKAMKEYLSDDKLIDITYGFSAVMPKA